MPITVEGKLDKFYPEETVVDGIELLEKLGLKDAFERQGEFVEFYLNPNRIKRSRNGQELYPPQIALPIEFTATTKSGEQVTISYYMNKRTVVKDGEKFKEKYPKKIYFKGKQVRKDRKQKMEEAIFLLLFPTCKESPFYKRGGEVKYHFKDRQKEASGKLKVLTDQFSFMQSIVNESSVDTLRRKARGIGIGRASKMNINEVKAAVMDLYNNARSRDIKAGGNNYTNEFISKWNQPNSIIAGTVRECIEKGVIEKLTRGRNTVYVWGQNQERRGRILEVGQGENPEHALIAEIVNKADTYLPILKNALHEKAVNSGASMLARELEAMDKDQYVEEEPDRPDSVAEMDEEQLVKWLIHFDAADIDRKSKKVYFVDPQTGEFQDEIMEVGNIKTWQQELAVFLVKAPDVQTTIKRKISRKYADLQK